jgi:mannose-1-phosphate guanylyltransferase
MLHVVIMAGGSGTRFWPLSRRHRPKQLLSLAADRPMLRLTYDRLGDLVPPERSWVITTADTAAASRELLPELPPANILAEPVGRDTAACAGLAALTLQHVDPEAVCVMLPADHVIGQEERFRSAIAAAADFVTTEGGLLTFGVRPTRPETGYGYLELGSPHRELDGWQVHRLQRFVEKPDPDTARSYLEAGGYLWNSGMFVWRASDFLDELRRQLPELASGLDRLSDSLGSSSFGAALDSIYPTLDKTSVDFGVMEGATSCWTVPVDFEWSDVGAWPALAELLTPDRDGNAALGRNLSVASASNLLVSDGPAVAVAGVEGLIVVATADAVLVVPAGEAQRVRDIVAELEARGWDDLL